LWDLSRQARTTEVATAFDQGLDGLPGRLRGLAGEDGRSFVESLDQFLSTWDFRGPSEWEIRAVTWGVSPDMVLATIDRMRRVGDEEAPSTKNSARGKQREEAATFMRETFAGNDEVLGQFEAVLNAAALWLRGRERGRTTAAMAIHEIRLPALELGERGVNSGHLARREHIFMLFANELDEYLANPGKFTETLADREKSYLALFDYVPPFVVSGEPPALTEWEKVGTGTHEKMRAGEILTGVSGCNGVARGRARVLLSPDDPGALEPGDILVAPITDPSWTPLFVAAAAVVVDVGAPFSHAAIVSRELGIPCVVSATAATKRIPDGALLEVDGGTGAITVIDDGSALV
jgi:pyruvate,water dikinase